MFTYIITHFRDMSRGDFCREAGRTDFASNAGERDEGATDGLEQACLRQEPSLVKSRGGSLSFDRDKEETVYF